MENAATATPPASDSATTAMLFGGVTLTVETNHGTKESVRVRQVPVREFPKYLEVMEDECRFVEFLCEKPPGWSDSLTPESSEQIVLEGEKVNSDFFSRWVRRRLERQEKLMPGITAQAITAASNSTTTLPK
jgi:hypothetical protein